MKTLRTLCCDPSIALDTPALTRREHDQVIANYQTVIDRQLQVLEAVKQVCAEHYNDNELQDVAQCVRGMSTMILAQGDTIRALKERTQSMQAEQFTPEEHAADPLRDAAPVSQKRFEAYCKSMDEWVKVQERRPDTKVDIGAFQQYQKFVRDQFAMQHHRVEHLAKRVTALETKQPQTY